MSCKPPGAGQPWPTAQPEEVDLDSVALDAAVEEAMSRSTGIFYVYRHGCLVASASSRPVPQIKRNMWSATKTVVALTVGRAATLGHLDVDDTVAEYFPEADPAHAAITIEQILQQNSGVNMSWSIELNLAQSSRAETFLSLPVSHTPGDYYQYAQTPLTFLTALVERAVGEDFQAFVDRELFQQIGIEREDWYWHRDRAGDTEGWAYLFVDPVDHLSRVGALMLQEGRWDHRQLIARKYMRALHTPSGPNPGYGYLTWLNAGERHVNTAFFTRIERSRRIIPSAPPDLYLSAGFHGQISVVIPSLDMVIARTSDDIDTIGPARTLDLRITGDDFGEGIYEIMRAVMLAVEDIDYDDPGPWDEPPEIGVDTSLAVNDPEALLASIGIARGELSDCNIVVCNGDVATEGTSQSVLDMLAYGGP